MKNLFIILALMFALTGCGATDAVRDVTDGAGRMVEDGVNGVEKGVDDVTDSIDNGVNRADENMKNNNGNTSPTSKNTGDDYVVVSDTMSNVSDYSSLSTDSFGFGFKKEEKGVVPDIGVYAGMIKGKNAIYYSKDTGKKIFLTFDEGYENGYTAQILDVLKEKQCPAAFFVTGDYLTRNDELVTRMIEENHIVGNHTWNHPKMPNLVNDESFKEELTKLDDYLYEKHKIKTRYFRYPSGEFSERSLQMIKDMGYKTAFWSLAYKDWERDVSYGADNAYNEVMNHIHDGAIILLHAVSADNANALGRIIDGLRAEGYELCSLDEANFNV